MDWLPWNLVCSIGVSGPIVSYSNDDWLDLDTIYIKVKSGRICLLLEKNGNCYFFLETVVAWTIMFVFAIN